MAQTGKRKRQYKKRPAYKKRKYVKKTYKSSSKGYKSKSINQTAKKIGTHALSYGKCAMLKKGMNWVLKKSLKDSSYSLKQYNGSAVTAALAGFQSAATITGVFTEYDLTAFPAPPPLSGVLDRSFVKDCSLSITLMNQSNVPTFVDLYDIVARQDRSPITGNGPLSYWGSNIASSGTGQSSSTYGATPFNSTVFTEGFKVLKITRINMGAGETAEHRCKYTFNRVFKKEIYPNPVASVEDTGSIRGLTHYVLIVTRGAPSDADDLVVGPAPTKIDFIFSKAYKYQPTSVGSQVFTTESLPTTQTKIMETDGDEQTYVTA